MYDLKIHDIENRPTIFYVTQHKCASQWILEILKWCAYRRVVIPADESAHFLNPDVSLVNGLVYPTLYIKKSEFDRVLERNKHVTSFKLFVVVRDLRDIMVSNYFSLKNSHPPEYSMVKDHRHNLLELNVNDGFIYMLENVLPVIAESQMSWFNSETKIFKYEDLTSDESKGASQILEFCDVETEEEHFKTVIENNSFKKLSGRNIGEEDNSSHLRKGVSGDWVNYFNEDIKNIFKEKFGDVLIMSGYENDLNW